MLAIVSIASWAAGDAHSDIVVLTNGGQIEGEVLNQEKFPREYLIQTPDGGRITLKRAQVKKILRRRSAEVQYESEVHKYPDTAEGQLAIAEWCRKKYLSNQRRAHLQRIIELEPDHEKARRLLGYSLYNGQWLTKPQWAEKNGLIHYHGRYRTAQEIELMERDRKGELAQKQWFRKISQWHDWIGKGGDRRAQAEENIRAIRDPSAVAALVKNFDKLNVQRVKLWYIEAFGNIPSGAAATVLVNYSLDDPDEEIVISCFEALQKRKSASIVRMYVKMLRDKDNQRVQRAAIGLNYMGDPSVIGPLIDALVTDAHFYDSPRPQSGLGQQHLSKAGQRRRKKRQWLRRRRLGRRRQSPQACYEGTEKPRSAEHVDCPD